MSAAGGLLPHDDAASGADAPGNLADALLLPGYGTYRGNASTPFDSDWYRVEGGLGGVPDPYVCVVASATGEVTSNVTLRSRFGPLVHEVRGLLAPWRSSVALAVALPPLHGVHVGFVPAGIAVAAVPGGYSFDVRALRLSDLGAGDGGTGGDVGDEPSEATRLPAGCVAGVLASDEGDDADAWSFPGRAGDAIAISFDAKGSEPARLRLLDPTSAIASTVSSGALLEHVLDADGEWTLLVDLEDGPGFAAYTLGFTRDAGRGCRPTCL